MQYELGGEGRTFNVDPNELCWFYLEELAKNCGAYMKIKEINYLIPCKSLDEGFRMAYGDKEVLHMAEIVLANRCIELNVLHGVDKPKIVPMIDANNLVDGAPTQEA